MRSEPTRSRFRDGIRGAFLFARRDAGTKGSGMLLKLSALLAMLFLSDAGGGAADGDGGDGGSDSGDGASSGDSNDTGGKGESGGESGNTRDTQPSANKLIKDFAKQRGISVEDLLSRYDELETSSKTETQRLMDQINDYKSRYESEAERNRSLIARTAIADAAKSAGAYDPDAIYDLARDGIELDDDTSLEIEISDKGRVTNVQAVIDAMKTKRPGLFKPATGTSDAGRPGDSPGGTRNVNDLLREMAGQR